MSARFRFTRAAAAGAVLVTLGVGMAQAQTYQNPALPRSPYALPTPTYNGPDDADDILGLGDPPRPPGQWRHWGDTRNEGETFQRLFVPNGVVGSSERDAEAVRRTRFCNFHPEQC